MTTGPPIPEIQYVLENSRSKVKVKGTPVNAASSWLISLVFNISASYGLPSLSFHDIRAPHTQDTIWPWKVKVKGTSVSTAPSWLISLMFHIRASYRLLSLSFHENRSNHVWFEETSFRGFSRKVEKCWQNGGGGGGNGPKTISPSVTRGDLITTKMNNSTDSTTNPSISHNTPLRTGICTFLFWIAYSEMWAKGVILNYHLFIR